MQRFKAKLVHMETAPLSAWAFLRGQLTYMQQHGYDVTLICAPGPELYETGEREGVKAIPLPMRREPAPFHDAVALVRLTRLLRQIKPDIIQYGTPKAALLGGVAATLARVPIRIMTLRGMRADGLKPPKRNILLAMERISCWTAHTVYSVSESLKKRAIEVGLAPARKLKVIGSGTGNGIDSQRFQRTPDVLLRAAALRGQLGISEDAPVIGFVGRLVRDKGVGELLDAYRQLKQEFSGLKLLLVGPFEDYDGLAAEQLAEIRNDPDILHLGFLKDPVPAYALMDVVALPTYREGFPNVPMEAAAMELPAVVTRVTGCVDAVVDGETGTIVPVRDPAALAAALRSYLLDPELSRIHGIAGRERVERDFQPEEIWSLLDREYEEFLAEAGLGQLKGPTTDSPEATAIHRAKLESETNR